MNTETVGKPWGSYSTVFDNEYCKVKLITIKPGCQPSYQYHTQRAEQWIIVQGQASITLDDITQKKTAGASVFVDVGVRHRAKNIGDDDLVFIEIQTGTYFGEDDIVRIEDDF
jgi:mannose-6-phosphate isomerase